jgi:serralysin
MENDQQWCFAWFATEEQGEGKSRAALQKGFSWKSRDVITIGFLDGDPTVQKRVQQAALEWIAPGMANLRFSFVPKAADALVRISFRYPGSWSSIGTSCKRVTNRGAPTMNFGWLRPTSTDEEVRRVVLHEFGHALGLIHEHQNPGGAIQWNRDAVTRDLSGPPNKWTPDVIQRNMFQPYAAQDTNFTALDPTSIMMYPIPSGWTLDGLSVGLNSTLSAQDKSFIHKQYP